MDSHREDGAPADDTRDGDTTPAQKSTRFELPPPARPSREEAEAAIRTLLAWTGDDPTREGLLDTPKRVVKAYEELFADYDEDPVEMLQRTFEETDGYDEIVLLRGIRFTSFCEHHLAPIVGIAHVGYLPRHRVVGISKLARVVETYAKRLQIRESSPPRLPTPSKMCCSRKALPL